MLHFWRQSYTNAASYMNLDGRKRWSCIKNRRKISLTLASCSLSASCIGVVLVAPVAEAAIVVPPFPPPLIESKSIPEKKLWDFLQEVPP